MIIFVNKIEIENIISLYIIYLIMEAPQFDIENPCDDDIQKYDEKMLNYIDDTQKYDDVMINLSNASHMDLSQIEKPDETDVETDIDEKEFNKILITNELFVNILKRILLILVSYGLLCLFFVILSG